MVYNIEVIPYVSITVSTSIFGNPEDPAVNSRVNATTKIFGDASDKVLCYLTRGDHKRIPVYHYASPYTADGKTSVSRLFLKPKGVMPTQHNNNGPMGISDAGKLAKSETKRIELHKIHMLVVLPEARANQRDWETSHIIRVLMTLQ